MGRPLASSVISMIELGRGIMYFDTHLYEVVGAPVPHLLSVCIYPSPSFEDIE